MDRQPVLEGERLTLRPLREDDWEALYAVASDPAVWEQHPAFDRSKKEVFREFFADALAKGGALAVIDTAKDKIIGSSRFQEHCEDDGGSVEIGWTFLSPSYWGKGFNAEMKRLMLTHAFQYVGRVDFKVGETNYRSQIALERIGAVRTRRTDLSVYRGRRLLNIFFEITSEDFSNGPLVR
jgi:RimJ/RimL family protein N-acetyltransferase